MIIVMARPNPRDVPTRTQDHQGSRLAKLRERWCPGWDSNSDRMGVR